MNPPSDPGQLESWLAEREAAVADARPDNHARICWGAAGSGQVTDVALVFLHGFSASPRELSPFPEQLASAFGANLYLPRLSGHGRQSETAMDQVSVAAWQQDAREAFEVAAVLGRRVIFVGSSTGATLGAWVALQPWAQRQLAAQIWVSPNFGVADRRALLLGLPAARRWLHWLVGTERRVEPESEAHARYWSLRYPLHAVVTMHELVQQVRKLPVAGLKVPVLAMYCQDDQVVAATRTDQFLRRLPAAQWERVLLPPMAEGSNHVLLGDAAGDPEITAQALTAAREFLERRLELDEVGKRNEAVAEMAAREAAVVGKRGPQAPSRSAPWLRS